MKQYRRLDRYPDLSRPKWRTHIHVLWAEKLKTTSGLQKFDWSDVSVTGSMKTPRDSSI